MHAMCVGIQYMWELIMGVVERSLWVNIRRAEACVFVGALVYVLVKLFARLPGIGGGSKLGNWWLQL